MSLKAMSYDHALRGTSLFYVRELDFSFGESSSQLVARGSKLIVCC